MLNAVNRHRELQIPEATVRFDVLESFPQRLLGGVRNEALEDGVWARLADRGDDICKRF